MIVLEGLNLEWIKGANDDPIDQCAHGRVNFKVNETVFVNPDQGVWALSASGLFLLRTLENDHTWGNPIAEANYLFPCCGSDIYPTETSRFGFVCNGCPAGLHVAVTHEAGRVRLFDEGGGSEEDVSMVEWTTAVFEFVAQVERFYENCTAKVRPIDKDEAIGWEMFWQEWNERRARR